MLLNLGKLIGSLYLALVIFIVLGFWAGDSDRADSIKTIRARGARACSARICDDKQRIGAAESDGIDGTFRRAAAYRWVRDANRVFVQPDWINAIPCDGVGVRRPGSRDDDGMAHVVRSTNHNDVDIDAHFQRSGRRAAGITCHSAGRH